MMHFSKDFSGHAKSKDSEVGDGTTTVTLLAAEWLKQIKEITVIVKRNRGTAGEVCYERCELQAHLPAESFFQSEMQPKKSNNPMITLVNIEVKQKDTAEIKFHTMEDYQHEIDIYNEYITDNFKAFVRELAMVQINALMPDLFVYLKRNIKTLCFMIMILQLLAQGQD
ncbi:T-complex protein 1 subunit eta [Heterocephalus glaber]|uniref:T-complex protein 1 subunit eta n=1 Tax=Heterocephalus glaber TaxID=10181 RepID=G5APG4_HETGA|nr:T-complex protein 1 subunit eta [Heterocephalus glaber]